MNAKFVASPASAGDRVIHTAVWRTRVMLPRSDPIPRIANRRDIADPVAQLLTRARRDAAKPDSADERIAIVARALAELERLKKSLRRRLDSVRRYDGRDSARRVGSLPSKEQHLLYDVLRTGGGFLHSAGISTVRRIGRLPTGFTHGLSLQTASP
jgi:hypothetical protein